MTDLRLERTGPVKPILFNTEMVRATMKDRKTETRRLVKPQFPTYQDREPGRFSKIEPYGRASFLATHEEKPNMKTILNPPYLPGDILYVRETWGDYRECRENGEGFYYLYRADYPDEATTYQYPDEPVCDLPKWHPSIHMPKEAARIFLHVTGLRAEQLQNITEEGAQSEGIRGYNVGMGEVAYSAAQSYQEAGSRFYDHPIGAFADLWNSTLKHMDHIRYGWAADPWVWVISFERCEKPEGWPWSE